MVDGGGLENHCTGNRTGGSNPSPSATTPFGRCGWRECASGFERLAGFSALKAGQRNIETTVRRSNGRWVAVEVERSGGGGSHDDDGDDDD